MLLRFIVPATLLWVLVPLSATAQPPFADTTDNSLPDVVGRSMHALAVDIDRDGDLDIVVAREFQSNVVLVNDGNGVFRDESDRLPRAEHDSEEVLAADFNDDGAVDLMFVSEDDVIHELYFNDGAGRFYDASGGIPVRSIANGAVVLDLNADSLADVILANDGQNVALVNDGNGGFRAETDVRLPAIVDVTQDMETGDIDGDGDLDLIVANEDANYALVNDGNGVFQDLGGLPDELSESRMANLADFDGDGDLDVFFANVSTFRAGIDPQNHLFLNDGGGVFVDATNQLPRDTGISFESKALDLDCDGDIDIIVGDTNALGAPGTMPVRAWLNDGTGHFTEADDFFPQSAAGNVFSFAVGDYDGDGTDDIYLAVRIGTDRLLLGR